LVAARKVGRPDYALELKWNPWPMEGQARSMR
jgi:hypothetical protein